MSAVTGYQIITKIYESDNSLVYRAVRDRDNLPIILKVLKQDYPTPAELTRYKQEYEITRSLNLDGVIKVYELQRYQNSLVMLLEDFGGESLKLWIAERKLTLEEFLTLAIKIADSLGGIHAANIIHKDINPSNIVYNPETGQLKIIDFGISTVLSRENPTVRNPDRIEGTLAYISPEQTGRMNRAIDYRTDFYSLGVTFYELLTHQLPFETTDALELVHCHIAKQPVPPHELVGAHGGAPLPTIISDIVMKLMAKTAEERYQSAWGLKADLETCLHQLQANGQISEFPLARQDRSDKFQISQKLYGREEEVETLLAAFERVATGVRLTSPPTPLLQGEGSQTSDSQTPDTQTPPFPSREGGQGGLGRAEMILVAGYSGIGKSALVNEIQKPIVRQRGYFISGKFDQFKRNIPYASLSQALQELIRQLLTESEARLQTWKQELLEALGSNGQVIIDVIPDVEGIIGKQPPVPQLGQTESQNRFNLVFQKFLGVFTKKEHPLVIFLDDLQWADSGSLKLLELLMTDTDSQYLLLMGAYRDNEVSATHPLIQTLEQIQKMGARVNTITLRTLDINCVNQLIADTLNSSIEQSMSLAELLHHKTNGNPFFLTQLLQALHADKLLSFPPPEPPLTPPTPLTKGGVQGSAFDLGRSKGGWQWNIEQIQAVGITDNVVELMISKIEKLDERTQNVLKLAACIGNQFDLEILSVVNAKSLSDTANELWSALQEGLIVPLSNDYKIPLLWNQEAGLTDNSEPSPVLIPNFPSFIPYKFLHDRVQQAAYALIPDDHKKEVHLKVGKLLLKNTQENELEENIFDIVNQLDIGVGLIIRQSDRDELAKLNLIASKKAKAAMAYDLALRYIKTALTLLAPDSWKSQYELTLNIYVETVELEFLNTQFEDAEKIGNIVIEQAKTLLDKVKVYELKIQSYLSRIQFQLAIDTALPIVEELGVSLPKASIKPSALARQLRQKLSLDNKQIEDLADLQLMTDPYKLAALRILLTVTPATYITNPTLLPLVIFTTVNLCIKYGNPYFAAAPYAWVGSYLCGTMGDVDFGYRFCQLSLKLLEQFGARQLTARVCHLFNSLVRHWKDPIRETIAPLLDGVNGGIETGDFEFACFTALSYCIHSFFAGENLQSVENKYQKYIEEVIKKLKQEYSIVYGKVYKQIVLNLTSKSLGALNLKGSDFDESETLKVLQENNDGCTLMALYLAKAIIQYFFKSYVQAIKNARLGEQYEGYSTGLIPVAQTNIYYSLALLAQYPNANQEEQKQYIEKVSSNQKRLKKWAYQAPANYQNKYDLIEAEKARVLGKPAKAMELYDRAIQGAREQGFIHEEAIAYERAAEFYLSLGREEIGQFYLKNAHHCYTRWGATAKVKDLEAEYPQILVGTSNRTGVKGISTTSSTTGTDGEALDLATVIKASQTLTSEIALDKLLAKLMKIAIENAGAQKGFLILQSQTQPGNEEGKWVIEAEGTVGKDDVTTLRSLPIDSIAPSIQLPLVCASIINYVVHTQENVVLNDATREGQFTAIPTSSPPNPNRSCALPCSIKANSAVFST
jgi:predicted ATPase